MSSSTETKFSNNPDDYPGQWIAWDSPHENIIAVAIICGSSGRKWKNSAKPIPKLNTGPFTF